LLVSFAETRPCLALPRSRSRVSWSAYLCFIYALASPRQIAVQRVDRPCCVPRFLHSLNSLSPFPFYQAPALGPWGPVLCIIGIDIVGIACIPHPPGLTPRLRTAHTPQPPLDGYPFVVRALDLDLEPRSLFLLFLFTYSLNPL
jgi:hypothetical protein